jgi:hypothetical protein
MNTNKCASCVFKNTLEPKRYCYMYTSVPIEACDMYRHPQYVQIEEINIDDFPVNTLLASN